MNPRNYKRKVARAASYLYANLFSKPLFGITLGSGLGDLADEIKNPKIISYRKIPYFPVPTAEGHEGLLISGTLQGVPVIGLKGRKHYYEVADQPYGMLQVIFPIHVLAELGVRNSFATNATGGLNPNYKVGDIMIIKDHMTEKGFPSPLLGKHHNFKRHDGGRVWRHQPTNDAYNPSLRELLKRAGSDFKDNVHEGTLITVPGPEYETPAECVFFRDHCNADAVGMSVVPEVLVARNRGMDCVGFSCITNEIAEDGTNATSHEEVMAVLESDEVKDRLTTIVRNFFQYYFIKNLKPI